ncbi:MAG: hypothetical protein ACTSXQ_05605 [Alphaproteobacteria bacterium]
MKKYFILCFFCLSVACTQSQKDRLTPHAEDFGVFGVIYDFFHGAYSIGGIAGLLILGAALYFLFFRD